MAKLTKAILKTVAYADIFNYPLTATEIHRWLINKQAIERSVLEAQLRGRTLKGSSDISHVRTQKGRIQKTKSYYHLKGRQSIVKTRLNRRRFSQLKYKKAHKITRFLRFIPTIKLVAVTGALAMKNSDSNDDIDLMIITKANRLWLTRLFTTLVIFPHLRRGHKIKNRTCLNLWLDETALAIPKASQNLYTAHEVYQIKPIFDKDNTYKRFLSENSWSKDYLPNAIQSRRPIKPLPFRNGNIGDLFNLIAFKIQHTYMKQKITNEKISLHSAFFHPRPTGQIILKHYQDRLKELKI